MRLSSLERHNLYLSLVRLPVEITVDHATIANSTLLLSFPILEAFRDPPQTPSYLYKLVANKSVVKSCYSAWFCSFAATGMWV